MIIKISVILGKSILLFITAIMIIITIEYITCPVYKFKASVPFSGKNYYNPYKQIDPGLWRKANFQVQSYAWLGLTSGRLNSNEAIYNTYRRLGYDIIATSDYQKINRFRSAETDYIPVYEHGYGIKKNHQVLIGAGKVLWTDYPIFQTIHNKQHILNLLRKGNELIFIAHPKLREGYKPEDMRYLGNYDGIEVLNNYRTSLAHWDSALSTGKYLTIIGDDDAHDISNPDEIGHHCTFINSPSVTQNDIISSLKSGRAFGAKINRPEGETFEAKIKRTKVLPVVLQVNMKKDTLIVSTDSIAGEIRFIGQRGRLLKTCFNSSTALCLFEKTDPYIRIEIEFKSRTIYYLNPVCRIEDAFPPEIISPEIDIYRTYLLRIIGFSSLLFIIFNYFMLSRIFRKRSNC
jgi:hypothetical protein